MKIGTLTRLIKKTHRQTHSWKKTAETFGISKALAERIVHAGFEPTFPATRERLGLDPIRVCSKCNRRIKKNLRLVPWHRLSDLRSDQVLWLLEHREVMS